MRLPQLPLATRPLPLRTFGILVLVAAFLLAALPASAAVSEPEMEQCLLAKINTDRAAAGLDALRLATDVVPGVRAHSEWMSDHEFAHMSDAARLAILPPGVLGYAENVAMTGDPNPTDCSAIHTLIMGSAGHRANVLLSSMRFAAIGAHIDGQGVWVTELFFDASGYSPEFDGTFWDDDGSPFEADIERLAAAGITSGCGPEQFCPAGPVTRGQMAAFLVRALDLPDAPPAGFTDTVGNTFANDIDRLAAAGITMGCSADQFCPGMSVSRGQMAAFLVRSLGLPDAPSYGFSDTVGNTFANDIDRLAAAGVTLGCGANAYCPNEAITRAQMAAFLVRGLGL